MNCAHEHCDSLNDDTSWLLTWQGDSGEPFHLVIDPWLSGSQVDYFPLFSKQTHVVPPAFVSLKELEDSLPTPISAILLSHEFTDHCHQATLETAPDKSIPIFGHPGAKKRIDEWKIFPNPVNPTRIYHKKDSPLPDSLHDLASRSKASEVQLEKAPKDVYVLYLPTDSWLDPAGEKLHGLTLIYFTTAEHTYSILYSPHGLPGTALDKTVQALRDIPTHTCLALLHNFDFIRLPLLGTVNMGRESGKDIVQRLKPRFYIRTHGEPPCSRHASSADQHYHVDELKQKEGLVGAVLQRTRETLESMQTFIGDLTTVKILQSGESIELL